MAKKRRKKKKSHKIYALLVIILGLVILVSAFLLLFYVQKVEVSGNEYTEDKVIVESLQKGKNDEKDVCAVNTVYLLVKYRFMEPEIPKSLESMQVSMKNPWTIRVKVKEKSILGYIAEDSAYAYFDQDGEIVLKSTVLREGVPGIEGLDAGETKLYQKLKVKSQTLLNAILDVAAEVKNYNLTPDRIVCEDGGIKLYFGGVRVELGTDISTEKMAQISPIIARLEGKTGVLHLEYYEDDASVITFTEEELEEETLETGDEMADEMSGEEVDE